MTRPLIIGLTGPTGAGKSIVAHTLLNDPAIRCLDMDALARVVTAPGHPTLQALAKVFSPDILREDGSLNRQKLASLAFSTPEGTQQLNDITHPAIWRETERRLAEYAAQSDVKAVLLDAPLLLEAGMERICHKVIAVVAPPEIRIARIMVRDGISEAQARLRMQRQQPDTFYTDKADLTVHNPVDTDALSALLQQVRKTVEGWCACD
ncbi:MAG: dephospho-CoA kinase [Clostridia bacterium]|nr:dephospho-CoA kinase [Clostridia bacterium]